MPNQRAVSLREQVERGVPNQRAVSLREQVERIVPNWESWYPSLFHAAEDLGLIRARVCSPGSLLLSTRHASVQSAALAAHRRKWNAEE